MTGRRVAPTGRPARTDVTREGSLPASGSKITSGQVPRSSLSEPTRTRAYAHLCKDARRQLHS
jgi:hypothetical protein